MLRGPKKSSPSLKRRRTDSLERVYLGRSANADPNLEDQIFSDRDHGHRYWKELIDFMNKMAQRGMIAEADLSLIYATDSVDEAIAHVRSKAIERFGLKRAAHARRHFPWLGECGLLTGDK